MQFHIIGQSQQKIINIVPWTDAAHLGCLRMSPKESPPIRLVASIMFWKVDSAGQEVKSVEAKVHAMFLPFLLLKGHKKLILLHAKNEPIS